MSPRPRPRASNLRLAADIGGTFTDIAAFDDRTGNLTFGKALSTPDRLVEGINAGVEKAGSRATRRPGCSCTARPSRSTPSSSARAPGPRWSSPRASATSMRSAASTGRMPTTCSSRNTSRWSSGRCGSRSRSGCWPTARSRRRSTRPRSLNSAGCWSGSAWKRPRILFLNCYARHDHEARAKAILEKNHPSMFVSASHELSQEYREFERCSTVVANAYIGPIVRRYIGEIDDHIRRDGFRGSFLIVQSTGGLYEAEQAQGPLRAHAGIGSGRRRHRHPGALPHARAQERDRLRHGRHHRQGRRHLPRRGAHHRRRADRRLRQGAAGADRHDGHLRGRHRRRLDRAGGGGRLARRPAERRRRARSRLLRPRRHRADRDRRQSGARPARRRSLPRRRDAARRQGRRARTRRARRQAARHGRDRGRRRHPAHRRHRHVLCGQGRHHRARSRRRRLRAGRLWRRRAAACGAGRARDRHPQP